MKTTLTIIAGTAVLGGLIYYFRDKEPVSAVLKRANDVLANASDMIRERYAPAVKQAENAFADIA
jgi:fructose-1-phosphate kinase PfkB-like protein